VRALVQRVARASVRADGETVAEIGTGLLVLLGVARTDGPLDADRLAAKVRALRIFPGDDGRPERALGEREVLVVSQFTLYADTRRGNRPGWSGAAGPDHAEPLYERFAAALGARTGRFGAHMEVELVNDGPVTVLVAAPASDGLPSPEHTP